MMDPTGSWGMAVHPHPGGLRVPPETPDTFTGFPNVFLLLLEVILVFLATVVSSCVEIV